MKHCEFEKEEKYKLFRTVKELLHPTISKKNISDYKIIIRDDLLPVRISYPKKISNLDKLIIYIHGESKVTNCKGKYTEIVTNLSQELDQLIISIDYDDSSEFKDIYNSVYETFIYIYDELIKIGLSSSMITVMADSTGTGILFSILEKMNKVGRMILFYPVISGEYFGKTQYKSIEENNTIDHDLIKKLKTYYKKKNEGNKEIFPYLNKNIVFPKSLVIVGGVDPLIDENRQFVQENDDVDLKVVTFANHGFLGSKDSEIQKEYYQFLHDFFKENN